MGIKYPDKPAVSMTTMIGTIALNSSSDIATLNQLLGVCAQPIFVRLDVRAKRATTAWRAGQQAQNEPQALRLMASVTCRWRSA